MIEVLMLTGGVGLALYLLWSFFISEKERERKIALQDEFDNNMSKLAASLSFDPDNFVLDVRNLTPAQAKEIKSHEDEDEIEAGNELRRKLRREHNGFGYEWTRKGSLHP